MKKLKFWSIIMQYYNEFTPVLFFTTPPDWNTPANLDPNIDFQSPYRFFIFVYLQIGIMEVSIGRTFLFFLLNVDRLNEAHTFCPASRCVGDTRLYQTTDLWQSDRRENKSLLMITVFSPISASVCKSYFKHRIWSRTCQTMLL